MRLLHRSSFSPSPFSAIPISIFADFVYLNHFSLDPTIPVSSIQLRRTVKDLITDIYWTFLDLGV